MAFKPERSLKLVLTSLFNQYSNENGVSATRVQAVYRQTMGAYISNHTKKIYVKNNVLFLYIDVPSLRHELSLGKIKLINILNEALGEQQIKEVVFH
jgi:predicted nucleic acid-binding Zn ribbon protein